MGERDAVIREINNAVWALHYYAIEVVLAMQWIGLDIPPFYHNR